MSGARSIVPFTLRYDSRWSECSKTYSYPEKWYRIYLDGVEYGRLCVQEHGGACLFTSDGSIVRDLSTMQDCRSIRECLHGSKGSMPATQEVLF